MAGPLARLYATLGMDASDWDRTMKQVQTDTQRFGGLTRTALRATAGAVGAGMAFAAKGALDMENRQAAFQAETGASAEEAAHFGDVVNKMSGSTLVAMDDIAMSATKIRTDLNLMGDAADQQLARFVAFERATKQGSDAVIAFDDILDAWNLEATATAGIMDVLVKSHQLYGGSIQENQRMLAQLAPALQAANFSWEEGQGLLNLFSRAGVGAEAAQTAFNRALSKVESPDELRRLLEDISATEDPFLRAQKAAELFGARAGTKLAQALSDADGDLGRFTVSVGEAAGATEQAAAALDSTLTSKIQLAINKGTSLLRGFGQDVGPILMGSMAALNLAGALGLDRALPQVWRAVAGSTAVKGAIAAAGAAAGVIYAGAVNVGSRLLAPLQAAWSMAMAAGSRVMVVAEAAGMATGTRFAVGLAKGVTLVGIASILAKAFEDTFGGESSFEAVESIKDKLAADLAAKRPELRDELEAAGYDMGAGLAEGIGEGAANAGQALAMTDSFASAFQSWQANISGALSSPLEAEFDAAAAEVKVGFGNIKQALANPPQMISRGDRLANMDKKMRQVVRNIRKSIDVGDPWSQRYWERAQASLTRRIIALGGSNVKETGRIKGAHGKSGRAVEGTWRAAATTQGREATRGANLAISQAQRAKSAIDAIDMVSSGRAFMAEFAAGILGGIPAVSAAASAAGRAAALSARASYAAAGGNTYQIGTLVASDAGIDELDSRIERRRTMRGRGPMRYKNP